MGSWDMDLQSSLAKDPNTFQKTRLVIHALTNSLPFASTTYTNEASSLRVCAARTGHRLVVIDNQRLG